MQYLQGPSNLWSIYKHIFLFQKFIYFLIFFYIIYSKTYLEIIPAGAWESIVHFSKYFLFCLRQNKNKFKIAETNWNLQSIKTRFDAIENIVFKFAWIIDLIALYN